MSTNAVILIVCWIVVLVVALALAVQAKRADADSDAVFDRERESLELAASWCCDTPGCFENVALEIRIGDHWRRACWGHAGDLVREVRGVLA